MSQIIINQQLRGIITNNSLCYSYLALAKICSFHAINSHVPRQFITITVQRFLVLNIIQTSDAGEQETFRTTKLQWAITRCNFMFVMTSCLAIYSNWEKPILFCIEHELIWFDSEQVEKININPRSLCYPPTPWNLFTFLFVRITDLVLFVCRTLKTDFTAHPTSCITPLRQVCRLSSRTYERCNTLQLINYERFLSRVG